MIKKQYAIIISGLTLIIVLLCVYLFVVSPLINQSESTSTVELAEGEALYGTSSVLMYKQYDENEILSVTVHNEEGEYEIYSSTSSEGTEFLVRGKETANLDESKLSTLISAVDFTIVSKKLEDIEDYSIYGLSKTEESKVWYRLKTKSGDEYKVNIGDITPSNGGYYCKIDGRDCVYLLDTSVESLKKNLKYYISPLLAFPTSSDDYYKIDDFKLVRDGETIVEIDYLTEEEREANGSSNFFNMTYPTSYGVYFSNYETILKLFTGYKGSEVMEFDALGKPLSDEVKAKYGLDNPKYSIHFTYDVYPTNIYYSAPDENGVIYAYSELFNQICKLEDSSLTSFLDWEIIKFVNMPLFAISIYDIASIEIECDTVNEKFILTGDDSDSFYVTKESDGKTVETSYFREYYMNVLTLYLRDYAEKEFTDLDCYLTMTIISDKGAKTVYKFYPYSTGHCGYTVNGVGEFYILRDELDKLVNNTVRLINGEAVDNSDKT